jgi:acetylornithine/N-succinyldiaminopimelate aminotransferase
MAAAQVAHGAQGGPARTGDSAPVDRSALMHTYAEPAVTFVRGEGSLLYDAAGRGYLDFLSGLAVTSLGHAHPDVADAIADQARTLAHVSNLFGNTVGPEVAVTLDRLIGGGTDRAGGQVFFTNSGAEANECAIKLARRWAGDGRYAVVSTLDSFHGRTLAALAATGQVEKQEPFLPLPDGFDHVPFDDLDAMEAVCDPTRVAAVLVEPIMGEAGVVVPSSDYLVGLRQLCTDRNILLMVDEVQTGLGRTGRWFGFQHLGVEPDVVTMAKALGNGMPVGACWARAEVAAAFVPGDHGSTFGGQPLAMSAARATLAVMESEGVPARARHSGARLKAGLEKLPGVVSIRGEGLLLAAVLTDAFAVAACGQALDAGLVINAPRADVLRFAPSLLVTDADIDLALGTLGRILTGLAAAFGSTAPPGPLESDPTIQGAGDTEGSP